MCICVYVCEALRGNKIEQHVDFQNIVCLFKCETWSCTIRQEYAPRVLGSRELRKIYGAKKEEATGGWKTTA